jgi:hypothetical protein
MEVYVATAAFSIIVGIAAIGTRIVWCWHHAGNSPRHTKAGTVVLRDLETRDAHR